MGKRIVKKIALGLRIVAPMALVSLVMFVPVLLPLNDVAAQFPGNNNCPAGKICNPLKVDTVNEFLALALKTMVQLLFPVIVLFYVITGLMFIAARGKPEKLSTAKRSFLYTTIGAAILLGSYVLSKALDETLKQVIGSN